MSDEPEPEMGGDPMTGVPAHPDFEVLLDLVLDLDHAAVGYGERAPLTMTLELEKEGVNEASLTYLGMQRAMRLLGVQTEADLIDKIEPVSAMAAVYGEAFLVGLRFRDRKAQQQ